MTHEHTQTIGSIFSAKGYDKTKLGALATLLHVTGYNDGIIKGEPTAEEISSILSTTTTVEGLNTLFQENYFKKYRGNGERQQIEACAELTPHKDRIIGLFRELGYIDPVLPSRTGYDIAFVFGCAQEGLEGRIRALQELKPSGPAAGAGAGAGADSKIEVGTIFILAGDRQLWPDRENIAAKLFADRAGVTPETIQAHTDTIFTPEVRTRNNAAEITAKRSETITSLTTTYPDAKWPTEADMAEELARRMLPDQAFSVVNATGRDGKRPDTLDTVQAWKDKYEDKITTLKRVLAISNQPFIPEQMAPLGVLNPAKFEFDIVGKGCEATAKPELLLTAFAGCYFKQMQRDQHISKTKEMGAGGRTFP